MKINFHIDREINYINCEVSSIISSEGGERKASRGELFFSPTERRNYINI